MATKILNDVTIQSRVDTLANWVSKNPVLANGELALVRDGNTIEIRVGDGVTNFSGLTKLGGVGIVDDLTSNSSTSALSANQGRLLNENKVDKVTGKGLSTNNYDDDSKAKVDAIPLNPKYTDTIVDLTSVNQSISSLNINMNNKVDKVEGKGLSTNDYDSNSKSKVDNIPSNPKYTDTVTTVVDSLNSTSTTSALSANQGKILNENKVSKIEGKGLSTNDYDNTAKNKVDNIPENPKYTDTVTTIVDNLNSTSSTSALSAKQGKLLDENKVNKIEGKGLSTNDYDNVSKDKVDNIDVNLSNLMPISDGVLENYTEKLTTLASGAIDLNTGNVFTHTLSGDTTYSISNAVSGVAHSFTLIITQTSTVRTLTFPSSVKWQGGVIPDLSTASKTYVLTFMTIDGGTNWLGMFGGEF